MTKPDPTFDAIVVGGGMAGVVCAATLVQEGLRPLLIAETTMLGRNYKSIELDGHVGYIQQPAWHFGWDGGSWSQLIRHFNLNTAVHLAPPIRASIRGMGQSRRMPMCMSASTLTSFLFGMLGVPLDSNTDDVERVMTAGITIPFRELCEMHNVPIGKWLDEQKAGDLARHVIEMVAAVVAGIDREQVSAKFSVFGTFVHIRTYFAGEGAITIIEPDVTAGFLDPLAERIVEAGGAVWRGTHVQRVIAEDGRAVGVEMTDARIARAPDVALAVGNPRITRFFADLPAELVEPLSKEAALEHDQLMVLTVLEEPVLDITELLFIHDPMSGANVWVVPLHHAAPWNSPDDRQLCLQWWGGPKSDHDQIEGYLDEVCEEQFPGFVAARGARKRVPRPYHWLNPCFVGPKVPRQSPSIAGLWYVGESTEPVGGIATEQAAFAGTDGARRIARSRAG